MFFIFIFNLYLHDSYLYLSIKKQKKQKELFAVLADTKSDLHHTKLLTP